MYLESQWPIVLDYFQPTLGLFGVRRPIMFSYVFGFPGNGYGPDTSWHCSCEACAQS